MKYPKYYLGGENMKISKKVFSLLLAALMAVSFAACSFAESAGVGSVI